MERPIIKPIGTPVEELDTPALVVDMDTLESNIEQVHSHFRQLDAKLRPYTETHRCPTIAHKQLAVGGTVGGIAVASVGEAELFAQNGIADILLVNEVVTPSKINRLCALARQANITVAADNSANVRSLSEAARSSGVSLNVLVDINTGQDRSGVAPGQPALDLARAIAHSEALNFNGLLALCEAELSQDADAIASEAGGRIQQTLDTRELLEQNGIEVSTVSVSGTHCYRQASEISGVTEVLAGTYALMDQRHSTLLPELQPAAKVLAAVTSLPEPGTAILDTGRKAMGDDYGFPVIANRSDVEVTSMSAEHGKLQWEEDTDVALSLGDRIWFTPMDVGSCVNVYDYIQGTRRGRLESVLAISARGLYR